MQSAVNPVPSSPPSPLAAAGTRVHMIGIGGSGMSGAAAMLCELGATVAGSDLNVFEGMGELVRRGARVFIGHDEQHVDSKVQLVVISAAIPASNPELAAARRRGLPVIKYAELLGELMDHRRGVAIAGTHGKSTTTAMCAHLFREAGLSPSFVVGASCAQLGGGGGVGCGPHFIVESCEFDRSFLHLRPDSAAILNIEPDHLDCYEDLGEIIEAFGRFAANTAADGLLVCNGASDPACAAALRTTAPVETFGFEDGTDWQALNVTGDRGCYVFDVVYRRSLFLSTKLAIPGRYNVANALAAIALAYHAGAEPFQLASALRSFRGISRRLACRGVGGGVTVVDDYAHHPTEIRVTIEAARHRYLPKRIWVVFQPHQYARTSHFMEEFAGSFTEADEIIVPDVYGAREDRQAARLAGSEELVSRICRKGGAGPLSTDPQGRGGPCGATRRQGGPRGYHGCGRRVEGCR